MLPHRKWLTGITVVGLPLLAYGIGRALARPIAPHPVFDHLPAHPLAIAHRGGQGLWPSNTIYAFEHAVALGVDMLELDIHATADGALVVMHDDTVDRTTDGSGPIKSKTLAEIKELTAGYNWTDDDGQTYPYRGQDIRVPTLEEVFAAFPDCPMTVEIKQAHPSIAGLLCDHIRRHGKSKHLIVGSFHNHALGEFRRLCPAVATSGHSGDVRGFVLLEKAQLSGLYSPRAQALQVPTRQGAITIVTPRAVRAAHGRGMQVHVWTVNEEQEMERLLAMGVDGIITDYPDRLLSLRAHRDRGTEAQGLKRYSPAPPPQRQ